jgi:hypothetical protein
VTEVHNQLAGSLISAGNAGLSAVEKREKSSSGVNGRESNGDKYSTQPGRPASAFVRSASTTVSVVHQKMKIIPYDSLAPARSKLSYNIR